MRIYFLVLFLVCIQGLAEAKQSHKLFDRSAKVQKRYLTDDVDELQCSLEKNELPNVQILFLVDSDLPKNSEWHNIQNNLTNLLMSQVQEAYTAEFALASYSSLNKNICYELLHGFTVDPKKITKN